MNNEELVLKLKEGIFLSPEERAFNLVAPPKCLKADYEDMMERFKLAMSPETTGLLLIQSVLGHAQQGHTEHYSQSYPDTTIEDICLANKMDPRSIADKRQALIDNFQDWIFSNEEKQRPIDKHGNPLFGIDYFSSKLAPDYAFSFDMDKIKKGFVLGALMDSWDIRMQVNKEFGKEIGGGQYHLVDIDNLNLMGYSLFDLSMGENGDKIDTLKGLEIIVDELDPSKNITPAYVRYKVGKGASDDTAMIQAVMKYGFDEGMGCLLADATDTWDKFCSRPVLEGHDERIAREILNQDPDLVDDDEILEFVRDVCSIPKKYDPDSSQRYFLQIDPIVNQSAIEGHFAYAHGKPYEKMIIGFNRIENSKFFNYLRKNIHSDN